MSISRILMQASGAERNPLSPIATTTYNGSGAFTATHTFSSSCAFCVLVSCFYDSKTPPLPDPLGVTVDGSQAAQYAVGAYNTSYTEAAYIHTLSSPTTGSSVTISSPNEDTSQTWALYVYEFDSVLSSGAVTSNDAWLGTLRPGVGATTLTTPALTVSANSVVVHGVVAGLTGGDFLTNFTGNSFTAVPTSGSPVYYASASGFAIYGTAGSKTENWTISLDSGADNPFFYPAAVEFTVPSPNAWDISAASFVQSFSVASQDSVPTECFFKPDGTEMYVIGQTNDTVYQYGLSTAWDISTASYSQGFSVATEETAPTGLFFKPDGRRMYIVGSNGDDVNEYSLSTAWDVSSASYVRNFSVATEDAAPQNVFFKPDGTKMYVVGQSNDNVNEYDLSTAWNISTASYLQNFSVAAQETAPRGLFFKPDGTKMYTVGLGADEVNEYDLSTPWDVSSASFLQNLSVAAQDTAPQSIFFKPDGGKMYVAGGTNDSIYEYDL